MGSFIHKLCRHALKGSNNYTSCAIYYQMIPLIQYTANVKCFVVLRHLLRYLGTSIKYQHCVIMKKNIRNRAKVKSITNIWQRLRVQQICLIIHVLYD